MKPGRGLSTAALLCVLSAPAFAQKAEPQPPGAGEDTEVPRSRPGPTAPEPLPSVAGDPVVATSTKKFDPLDWKNALGVYAHYLFVTTAMLKPYLTASTPLNSFAVGAQYTRRYTHFDVVTSLDFSWLDLKDGNWLGAGNDPMYDTKYVQFDKLSFLSADVAIIGHYAFNDWLEIRGGAGLGLGVVLGTVYTTNDSTQCTKQNASDTSKCYPISPLLVSPTNPTGAIRIGQPDTNANLKKTEQSDTLDTAQNPHRKSSNKPPVMAVVNIQAALNFRLHRNVSTQIEIGFRDAMFVGAGVHYHF